MKIQKRKTVRKKYVHILVGAAVEEDGGRDFYTMMDTYSVFSTLKEAQDALYNKLEETVENWIENGYEDGPDIDWIIPDYEAVVNYPGTYTSDTWKVYTREVDQKKRENRENETAS